MHSQDLKMPEGDEFGEQPASQAAFGSGEGTSLQGLGHKLLIKGNLLLACLFAAGIGCVYLLSLRGGPQVANAQQESNELQVNAALAAMNMPESAKGASAASVVESFYTQASQRQLPMDSLKGNPFIFQMPQAKVIVPAAPASQPVVIEEVNAAKESSQMLTAAKALTLQSVLTGTGGATAMISNNLLTEGQTIHGWTISKIGHKDVLLTWKDQTFVLKLR